MLLQSKLEAHNPVPKAILSRPEASGPLSPLPFGPDASGREDTGSPEASGRG